MTRPFRWLLVGAGLAVGLACASTLERDALMFRHFGELREIRVAAQFGRIQVAHEAATGLRFEYFAPELPLGSGPFVGAVRAAAERVTEAEDRESLAQAASELAGACGGCHTAYESGPLFAVGLRPEGSDLGGHMRLHQWAIERMWDSLISGSGEGWWAGSAAMATEPIPQEDFLPHMKDPEVAFMLSSRVHRVAEEARRSRDPSKRVDQLADLLVACSHCHQLAGLD